VSALQLLKLLDFSTGILLTESDSVYKSRIVKVVSLCRAPIRRRLYLKFQKIEQMTSTRSSLQISITLNAIYDEWRSCTEEEVCIILS